MLPEPEAEALAASGALLQRIREELAAGGNWIGFARYMELALHEPGLGYYAGGAAKLGAPGDFATAPELGALFARTLARQVAELLQPGEAILEFGAGSGALAEALIAELSPEQYLILETSAELRARQEARLGARARWVERLPERFRGVMLANEVADAMPVHAVAWRAHGVHGTRRRGDRGQARLGRAPRFRRAPRRSARARGAACPTKARSGWSRARGCKLLAARLARGALLVVDYGFPRHEYYHPQRSMGTLMCHYRHRAHGDPFFHPGLQDITAHVDFSAHGAGRARWRAGSARLRQPGAVPRQLRHHRACSSARTRPTPRATPRAPRRRSGCFRPPRWARSSRCWRSVAASPGRFSALRRGTVHMLCKIGVRAEFFLRAKIRP